MKKMITLLIGLNATICIEAQTTNALQHQDHERCGTSLSKMIQESTPGFMEEHSKLELLTQNFVEDSEKSGNEKTATIIIPVVFHINKSSNPTDVTLQQIQSAIDILNEDYNGLNVGFTSVRSEFQSVKATIGIQFCLATKDPDGNPTNGVTYHTNNYDGREPDNLGTTVKTLSGWPCNQYLNIWTVRDPAGNGDLYQSGWAFLPYTPYASSGIDGIIYNDKYLGKYGTGLYSYNNESHMCHVLSHEVGHWLNLEHTFENYCSSPGDYVSDTPPVYYYGSNNCEQLGEKCSGVTVVNDENYMDYTDCPTMFTQGQKTRMLAALNSTSAYRKNLWTEANLIAVGCMSTNELESFTLIENVAVSPNPNKGEFEVNIHSKIESDIRIEIQDMMGRVIIQQEFNNSTGNQVVHIEMNECAKGIYNCVITSKRGERIVRKIMVE